MDILQRRTHCRRKKKSTEVCGVRANTRRLSGDCCQFPALPPLWRRRRMPRGIGTARCVALGGPTYCRAVSWGPEALRRLFLEGLPEMMLPEILDPSMNRVRQFSRSLYTHPRIYASQSWTDACPWCEIARGMHVSRTQNTALGCGGARTGNVPVLEPATPNVQRCTALRTTSYHG